MAKKSELAKVLASIDAKIDQLVMARALIVTAQDNESYIPKGKRKTKAPAASTGAAKDAA